MKYIYTLYLYFINIKINVLCNKCLNKLILKIVTFKINIKN